MSLAPAHSAPPVSSGPLRPNEDTTSCAADLEVLDRRLALSSRRPPMNIARSASTMSFMSSSSRTPNITLSSVSKRFIITLTRSEKQGVGNASAGSVPRQRARPPKSINSRNGRRSCAADQNSRAPSPCSRGIVITPPAPLSGSPMTMPFPSMPPRACPMVWTLSLPSSSSISTMKYPRSAAMRSKIAFARGPLNTEIWPNSCRCWTGREESAACLPFSGLTIQRRNSRRHPHAIGASRLPRH